MKQRPFVSLLPLILVAAVVVLITIRSVNRPEFDIIIENGTIVDGLGGEPFQADLGIWDDKIKKIGDLSGRKTAKIIDAAGLMVCPGFIDLHTHADKNILQHPDAHNYIRQGVTTVLAGNCGGSQYPIRPFLKRVRKKKIALNFCTLVGHNTIRRKVMGNADREPTLEELAMMKKMVKRAMKDGAFGLSTGLKYMPGAFADTDEVIELARVAREYGGFYATHMREEGLKILAAMKEAVTIGRAAKIPVQISHHKITSVDKWGSSVQTLALVEAARKAGIDVTLDQYPYPATSTGLTVLFPAWSLEGNSKKWQKRWNDAESRPRLVQEIMHNIRHDRGGNDLERIMLARYSVDPELEGLTIAQVLAKRDLPVTLENGAELIVQLQLLALAGQGEVQAIYFCLGDEDIERIMTYPHTAHASDGGIITFGVGKPHPRNYGTFPRVLQTYVREKKILSFAEAVRKMTALPAKRLGLEGRGRLKERCFADVTILDPKRAADTATWQNPHMYPAGIRHVLVNGQPVVEDSKITGRFSGKVLLGKRKKQGR